MEYKCIRVKNKSLSTEDFEKVYKNLCKLETGLLSENKQSILFSGKSETKQTYCIDIGVTTSEYNSFKHAINYYIKNYKNDVEII